MKISIVQNTPVIMSALNLLSLIAQTEVLVPLPNVSLGRVKTPSMNLETEGLHALKIRTEEEPI